jgi:hypothetical protein
MWSFGQAKIALILIQEWLYKIEVINLYNKETWKNLEHQECCILNPLQQILPPKG